MTNSKSDLLQKNLRAAAKARRWLQRSYDKCKSTDFDQPISDGRMDDLEAMTGRFARLTDILVHKVFRSLEIAELETPGTLIDTVNRMEKRGLIESTEKIRELKTLRNTIAHEYEDEELKFVMKDCLARTPELFEICRRVEAYCSQRGYC